MSVKQKIAETREKIRRAKEQIASLEKTVDRMEAEEVRKGHKRQHSV